MHFLTLFTTILATAVTVSTAMPSDQKAQIQCSGLNGRRCDNGTAGYSCCVPLTCGADARCHA
ncbi:hypothetical protein BJX76DRAFT_94924 [Aspergillus varians]